MDFVVVSESELEGVAYFRLVLWRSVLLSHRKSVLKMRESILEIRIHALGNVEQYWVEEAEAASVTESEGLTGRPD